MMKNIIKFIITLVIIGNSQFSAQKLVYKAGKNDHLRLRENSKGLSLKVKDLKTGEKNGKTSWTVKATLSNHSHDTLFYSFYPNCLSTNFMAIYAENDTTQLLASCENPATNEPIVITLAPKGKRTVDLEINANRLVTSSIKIRVCLSTHKAKNANELPPYYSPIRTEGDRWVWLVSNRIKT